MITLTHNIKRDWLKPRLAPGSCSERAEVNPYRFNTLLTVVSAVVEENGNHVSFHFGKHLLQFTDVGVGCLGHDDAGFVAL